MNECECCGGPDARFWMEWGEWLCSECCEQAIEENRSEDDEAVADGWLPDGSWKP